MGTQLRCLQIENRHVCVSSPSTGGQYALSYFPRVRYYALVGAEDGFFRYRVFRIRESLSFLGSGQREDELVAVGHTAVAARGGRPLPERSPRAAVEMHSG